MKLLSLLYVEGILRLLYIELTNFLYLWQWYYLTRKERLHRAILLTLFGPPSQVMARMVRRVGPPSCRLCSTSPLAVTAVYQKCKALGVVTSQCTVFYGVTRCVLVGGYLGIRKNYQ